MSDEVTKILAQLKDAVPIKMSEDGKRGSCPKCGGEELKFFLHTDSRDSFRNVYNCLGCDAVVYVEQKRSKQGRAYWS